MSLSAGSVPSWVAPALAPRLAAARRLLALSVSMHVLVVVLCTVALAWAAPGWWAAALPVAAAVPPLAMLVWLRRGVLVPAEWVKAAFLVGGVQFLVGVVPVLGFAGAAGAALFPLAVAADVVAVVAARRAHAALLRPLVPGLGATAFRIVVPVRFAIDRPAPVSARFEVGTGRLGWTARRHRGRSAGPEARTVVPFDRLRRVEAIVLEGEVTRLHWLTLPDGTVLYARPGPALRLVLADRELVVPVDDADVLAALVDLRLRS